MYVNEEKLMKRNEQKIENTWKIEDIYKNIDEFYLELESVKNISLQLEEYKGRLENASNLLSYLKKYEVLSEKLYTLSCYTNLLSDQDGANAFYQDLKGKANDVITSINAKQAFFEVELLRIQNIDSYFESESELGKYRRFIEDIYRLKPHTLSLEKEELLAGCQDIFSSSERAFYILNDVDTKFESVQDASGNILPLTTGNYFDYLENKDELLRKNAFDHMYAQYDKIKNTMASLLNSHCKMLKFQSDLRGYESSLEASTNENGIPSSVYKNLIDQVHKDIGPLHKYMHVRKKALQKEKLNMYDLYVPLVKEFDKEVSFEQAKKEALESISILGDEYVEAYKKGLESRWMDVYENEGKRSGAYSCGVPCHPFVLLNHTNTLRSEFTLAHEMGHAMHSYMSFKYQPFIDSDYKIFVAEVASTCNEALLMHSLLQKTTDKKERAYLINYLLEQYRGTMYRQTMLAEFEMLMNEEVAKQNTLSADLLNQINHDLNAFYYGDEVTVDAGIDLEWAKIPHLYMNFYLYQYATSFCASMAISQKLINGNKEDIQNYLNFLKGGCSKSPIELLKMAGVDMTTPQPIHDAICQFDKLVDEFDELINM